MKNLITFVRRAGNGDLFGHSDGVCYGWWCDYYECHW